MANGNEIVSPDDARFEIPDVNSLLEDSTYSDGEEPTVEEAEDVSKIDPYNTTVESDENENEDDVVESNSESDENVLYQYLKKRGISDPKKIQYEDENGNTAEVDFNSLSTEEQLNIIEELSKPNITDEEIQTIDYLRRNKMNLAQVVDYFANQKLQEYINQNNAQAHTYSIDEYNDDELYVADLKSRYPNLSDEDLNDELNAAKQDEDRFNKKVSQLREYYKNQENEQMEAQRQQEEAAREQYTNTLYNAVNQFNEIALDYKDDQSDTLEIEAEDKKRIMSYLLDTDTEGKTQFVRDIENPDALIELAWLRIGGADALSNQAQYYKEVISERNKEIARLRKQIDKEKTSNSIVVPAETKRTSKNSSSNIWDESGLL